jgi:hypothetical protein
MELGTLRERSKANMRVAFSSILVISPTFSGPAKVKTRREKITERQRITAKERSRHRSQKRGRSPRSRRKEGPAKWIWERNSFMV